MQVSARYFSICLMLLGFLLTPLSSAVAADAKPLSDLQLDDSRLTEEAIVCRNLDKDDPKVNSSDGTFFILRPKTETVKNKKTFLLNTAKNGENTDSLVALSGNVVPEGAKKSSDIPFAPEVLEISQTPNIADNLGVACSFVGGPRKQNRISELTDALEDGETGPGKVTTRRRFRKGPNGGRGRSSGYRLLNPCW